jgi:hypothetical protein
MALIIACQCGRRLQVEEQHAGKTGRCPGCGQILQIPALDAAAPISSGSASERGTEVVAEIPRGADSPGAPLAAPALGEALSETARTQGLAEPRALELWTRREETPSYRLYAPGDVALVTFLGGVLPGFVLLALNYRALGKLGAAWWTFLLGLVATGLVIGTAMALPENGLTRFAPAVVGLLVMVGLAKALQGNLYSAHIRRGGQKASGWAAVGIAVVGGLLTVGAIFAYAVFFEEGMGKKLTFGAGEEVYYTSGVTEAEARQLGGALQSEGYFNGKGAKTVQVSKQGDRYVVSFVLQPGAWNKPDVLHAFGQFRPQLSQKAFGGKPVELRLCDENMETKKTIE